MRKRNVWKAAVSVTLCGAMLLQNAGPLAQAWGEELSEEQTLAQGLLEMSEDYPEGGITFGEPQLTGTEGDKLELTILRQGNREKEAKVSLKAVDVSAAYGKDYRLKVKDGAFLSEILRAPEDQQTLMEQYGVLSEEEAEEAQDQQTTEEVLELQETEDMQTQEEAAQTQEDTQQEEAGEENVPQEDPESTPDPDTDSEETPEATPVPEDEQPLEGENPQDEEEQPEDEPQEGTSENEIPEVTPAAEPGAVQEQTNGEKYMVPEGKNSLQAARDLYLNQDSVRTDWREVETTDQQYEELRQMSDKSQEEVENVAQMISGAGYTFTFAPGEYKKVVEIELLDDDLSEAEEQVMFLLYQAENVQMGDNTTAYLNIQDNDETEEQIFGVDATDLYVSAQEESVSLTVRRTSGLQQFATVYVGTTGDTAQAGQDYTETQKELVFAQGETEKTAEIPLLPQEEREGEKIFYIGLKSKGGQVVSGQELITVHITGSQAEAMAAAARSTDPETESVSVNTGTVTASGYNSSKSLTLATNVNLSLADRLTVTVNSTGERNWTEKKGCRKEPRNSKEGAVTVEIRSSSNALLQSVPADRNNGFFSNKEIVVDLNDNARTKGAKVVLVAVTKGSNNNVNARCSQMKVHYPSYTYRISNEDKTNENIYIEQWYGYNNGEGPAATKAKLKLGNVFFTNGTNDTKNEIQVRKNDNSLTMQTVLNTDAKNSLGVAVSADNTSLKGVQLVNGKKRSEILQPDEITFDKAFIDKYSKDYMVNNTFTIYPIFEVADASLYLADTGGEANPAYDYSSAGMKKGATLKVKALDAVCISAFAEDGDQAVKRIEVGNIQKSGNVSRNSSMEETQLSLLERNIKAGKGTTLYDKGMEYTWRDYDSNCVLRNANQPEVIELSPRGLQFVYVQTETPSVKVYALKKGGQNLDKVDSVDENGNPVKTFPGSVIYVNDENEGVSGDPETPMEILGAPKYQPLTISSLTLDGYKTTWYERTGDTNEDGVISTEENDALEETGYTLMTPVSGNVLTFIPKLTNTIISYDFRKVDPTESVPLSGKVFVRDQEFLTGKEVTTPLAGATLTVNGSSTTTGQGGYYFVDDPSLSASDYVQMAVSYNGVGFSFIQNPGVAKNPVLDAYTGIQRVSATLSSRKPQSSEEQGDSDSKAITNATIPNDSYEYVLTVTAKGETPAIQPTEAILRFYRADGTSYGQEMREKQIAVDGAVNTGQFQFVITPSNINQSDGSPVILEPGSTMTIQFLDQTGVGYYEHPVGIKVTKAMGLVEFLNSFTVSAAGASILGNINAFFGMNWGGDLEHSDFVAKEYMTDEETYEEYLAMFVSTSEQFDTDRLGTGLNSIPLNGITGTARDKAKADQNLADANVDLKETSEKWAKETDPDKKEKLEKDLENKKKAVEKATEEAQKKNEKYEEAVEKSNTKKTTKVTMAVNSTLDLSFNMTIQMNYDEEQNDWYFKTMLLSAEATAGVDFKFVFATPIGLDVIITVGVGVDESEILLQISQRENQKVYLNAMGEESEGKTQINLFDSDMDNEDRQLDFQGTFVVQPVVDLSGDVGFSMLSTSVGMHAKALFDLKWYANPDETHKNDFRLLLTGGLHITILGMTKSWDYNLDPIDLDGKKSRTAALLDAMSDDTALYDSVDTFAQENRSYLNQRSGWTGEIAMARAASQLQETILQKGTYTMPDVQMANLGGGKLMAVYVDVDTSRTVEENQTAVYYTIFNGSGWTKPQILENDGKMDDAPVIADMGDRGVMIAWSAADREFASGENLLTMLSSRNIHTVIYDKGSGTFGEIQEATKTTEKDFTADVEPKISYYTDGNQERMLMYYAKNQYTATDNAEGVVGDAVYPYSVMAYQFYDFQTGEWRHTYTEEEKAAIIGSDMSEEAFADYEANWYGQGFLNLPPAVTVKEELDESGYWISSPEILPPSQSLNMGIVTDADAVTYSGLALFAYVLDKDGKRSTSADRDVYLQIYDYVENAFLHPVIITSNDVEEANVKLARTDQGTLLTYLSDQKINILNLSVIIGQEAYLSGETDGQKYYYLNKTNGSGYMPPTIIQAYADTLTAEETEQNAGRAINNFNIRTNQDGTVAYLLWTESASMLKEGIESGTPEAELAENQSMQVQIYGSRLVGDRWSGRTQITQEEAIYGNLDFAVMDDGTLQLMASKNPAEAEATGEKRTGCELVGISAAPADKLSLDNLTLGQVQEGDNGGTIVVRNEGFTDVSGLQLAVTDQAGNQLLKEDIETLYSGQNTEYSFNLTLPEGQENWSVTAELRQGDTVLASKSSEGSIPVNVTLDTMSLIQEETRDQVTVNMRVTNGSMRTVPEQEIVISDAPDGEALATVTVPKMGPGEYVDVQSEVQVKEEMFVAYTDDPQEEGTPGDAVEELTLYASGEYISGSAVLERRTPGEDIQRMRSITGVKLNQDKIQVKTGEYKSVEADIQSPLLKYDEFTTYKNYNLKVVWTTDNPDIAQVDENGMVRGLQEGETVLRARVQPRSENILLENGRNGEEMDNSLTLTSDSFYEVSIPVTVEQGEEGSEITPVPTQEPEEPSDGGGDGNTSGSNKPGSGDNADTGDKAPIMVLILLMIAAAAGGTGLVVYKKKKRKI